jgi:hypothetical protein
MGTPAPNEPDPLPAFTRFAYLWLLLIALRVAGLPLLPELTPPRRLAPLLDLAHAALLAAYLSAPRLRRSLGAGYLPAALIFAAFGAQAILLLSVRLDLSAALAEPRSFTSIVGIAHWLLLWPTVAVVIGWKYPLRQVVQFALAMWLFNLLAVALLFRPLREPSLGSIIAVSFLSVTLLTIGAFVRQLSQAEQRQREALASANAQLVQAAATLEQLTIRPDAINVARHMISSARGVKV